jgi:UTP:GlnB (protein PII) uridylyltransferase
LFKIAQVLADHQWYVESARITTEGIRAEDYFVVGHDTPDQVTAETLTQLTTAIQQALR